MTARMSIPRSILAQVAIGTAADAALATIVLARPLCNAVVGNQVAYIASLVARVHATSVAVASSLPTKKSSGGTAGGTSSSVAAAAAGGAGGGLRRPGAPVYSKVATPLQASFVLIGCGNVGSKIASALLSLFHPTSITIICRQPLQAAPFAAQGCRVLLGLEPTVLNCADAVIVACQPGQFSNIARNMKDNVKPTCVVISICCGIAAEKVAAETSHGLAMTTNVDTEAITRTALEWSKEDEILARYARAAYAALKSFEEVRDALSLGEEAVALERPETRAAARKDRLVGESFPAETAEFFGRLVYCLASILMKRQVSAADAVGSSWLHLVPPGPAEQLLVERWARAKTLFPETLAEGCNPSWLADAAGLNARELMGFLEEQFRIIISGCKM